MKKGFTLLEIIVSAFILSLLMMQIGSIFVRTKGLVMHSRSRITAGMLANYFLDPLYNQVRQDKWGSNCLSTGVCNSTNSTIDGILYTATYNITTAAGNPNLRCVNLTINWTEAITPFYNITNTTGGN